MNYNEAKLRQLDAISTYRVYGHLLDLDNGVEEEGSRSKRWLPVSPCWCVQSSDHNPCICDRGIIWWLPIDGIIAKGSSMRKDNRDKELRYFDLRLESTITMESVQSINAGELKNLESNPSFKKFRDLVATADGFSTPQVIFFWSKVGEAILGWVVGKFLDLLVSGPSIWDLIEEEKKKQQQNK